MIPQNEIFVISFDFFTNIVIIFWSSLNFADQFWQFSEKVYAFYIWNFADSGMIVINMTGISKGITNR